MVNHNKNYLGFKSDSDSQNFDTKIPLKLTTQAKSPTWSPTSWVKAAQLVILCLFWQEKLQGKCAGREAAFFVSRFLIIIFWSLEFHVLDWKSAVYYYTYLIIIFCLSLDFQKEICFMRFDIPKASFRGVGSICDLALAIRTSGESNCIADLSVIKQWKSKQGAAFAPKIPPTNC